MSGFISESSICLRESADNVSYEIEIMKFIAILFRFGVDFETSTKIKRVVILVSDKYLNMSGFGADNNLITQYHISGKGEFINA